jgi:hypothetical protein
MVPAVALVLFATSPGADQASLAQSWHDVRVSPVTAGDPRPVWARLDRWCLLGAFGCIACAVVSVMMIINALQAPDTGTDAGGMAIASGVIVVAASAVGAVALIIAAIVRRAPARPDRSARTATSRPA